MNGEISQIHALTEKRQRWITANRENGFEDGITNLLTELYPDNAHFIYELLQNAEDTKASKVCFELTSDSIRFTHDGKRLFCLKDVDSITSIGTSTKRNDPTSIGKFGVGFKAVFSYTRSPVISSDGFHFRITDLVVPEFLQCAPSDGRTSFYFPFDNPKKSPLKAEQEIRRGLTSLSDSCLLFLEHIREIEYRLPNGAIGSMRRVDEEPGEIGQRISIHTGNPDRSTSVSNWLRYSRNASIRDEHGTPKPRRVSIAFLLEKRPDRDQQKHANEKRSSSRAPLVSPCDWSIAPCMPGSVSIFFPAEKETSNLRFHLHAPFASTVARDSVRDCDDNKMLRDAIAQLVAESLLDIRARKLLTVDFLAVLPHNEDTLTEFYRPIRDVILRAFKEHELVPTKAGTHGKSGSLYTGPSEISKSIDDDDLSLLTGYNTPLWAANAPQRGQREDKFLESLEIDKWSYQELVSSLLSASDDLERRRDVGDWIANKSDSWLLSFYALLESASEQTYRNLAPLFQRANWIRVSANGSSTKHIPSGEAFFPPPVETKKRAKSIDAPDNILFVTLGTYSKGGEGTKRAARAFLERVGVRVYDEEAEIVQRLEWYTESHREPFSTIPEQHYRDIRRLIAFLKKNPNNIETIKDVPFLAGVDVNTGEKFWTMPEDIVLDAPYQATGLGKFQVIHQKRKLCPDYIKHLPKGIRIDDLVTFLKQLGATWRLEVVPATDRKNREIRYEGRENWKTRISEDWTIEHLGKYLTLKDRQASRLVWDAIICASNGAATARYCPSLQGNLQTAESQLVQQLKKHAWIPGNEGRFLKPQEMTQKALPAGFVFDDRNGLLTAIGFGEDARKVSAEYQRQEEAAMALGFRSVKELNEARELLKMKKEGRIREIPQEAAKQPKTPPPTGASTPVIHPNPGTENGPATPSSQQSGIRGASPNEAGRDQATRPKRVRDRILTSIPDLGSAGGPQGTHTEPVEPIEDDDIYTPAPVDYSKRIAQAERRNADEIAQLEREQALIDEAEKLPKYSYGRLLALLELELLASNAENSDCKQISISFGSVQTVADSPRTVMLKEPDHYIPQSIEEFSGVPAVLEFADGTTTRLMFESFTARESTLCGKLAAEAQLSEISLGSVVRASITIQNPSFLLKALFISLEGLRYEQTYDMKANLPLNIEFVFGPPGTGKTTHLAEKLLIPLMRADERAKVLVLTPTNKAADVLVTRIIERMGTDAAYRDWLVRFGTTADGRIEAAGVLRDRSFDIEALPRSVTVTTIARFGYDGFSTKSGDGRLDCINWDLIVIDEASMIPLHSIIYPLYRQQPGKFVIAGDPFQIEPIVKVEQWQGENIYSLVELDRPGSFAQPKTVPHNYKITNLETQYRSVPGIGEVFSRYTYNGILKHHRMDSAQRSLRIAGVEAMPVNLIKFPVSKYESIYRAKRLKSGTPYQTYSALFAFEFVRWLSAQIQRNHANEAPFRIGVIAPYRAQANLLSKLHDSVPRTSSCVEIQVGTIHGFQGDECDIIIAVLNPPPTISRDRRLFLNKQNILNVAISRARDYLFIIMPDEQTTDVGNLTELAQVEHIVREVDQFSVSRSHDIEKVMLGHEQFLEENTFSTGHHMVNVYSKPERYYEVRSDDSAIDVQIHEEHRRSGVRSEATSSDDAS